MQNFRTSLIQLRAIRITNSGIHFTHVNVVKPLFDSAEKAKLGF